MVAHLYHFLELLAASPQYRGCVASRKLIDQSWDMVNSKRREAKVEARDEVLPLYEKFGWKVTSSCADRVFSTSIFHAQACGIAVLDACLGKTVVLQRRAIPQPLQCINHAGANESEAEV